MTVSGSGFFIPASFQKFSMEVCVDSVCSAINAAEGGKKWIYVNKEFINLAVIFV